MDVGQGPNDAVRLFCSQGSRAQFAALSHCWGGRIEPLLRAGTLDQFQASIPYSSLAANFRDAITITRNLGIRYLWIDSLCIIQDSKRDWEQESKRMGSVYRDAAVTILAAASEGSKEGILNRRPLLPGPKPVKLKVSPDSDATVTVSRYDRSSDESLWSLSWKSPLATRGWTLQEASLSPRSLVYGAHGVYWQCSREFRATDGLVAGINLFPEEPTQLDTILRCPSLLKQPAAVFDRWMLFNEYYTLVSSYTQRSLTVASDKLPAMSAIATTLSEALADRGAAAQYLAGLWDTDVLYGMTWHEEILGLEPHGSVYRAPSWSWAVTDGPVVFGSDPDNDRSTWGTSRWDMKLLSHQMRPKNPDNPFGEVEVGRLVVEGLTMPLVRSLQTVLDETPGWESNGTCYYDEAPDESCRPNNYFVSQHVRRFVKDGETCLLSFYPRWRGHDDDDGTVSIDEGSHLPGEYKLLILCITDPDEPQVKDGHGIVVRRRLNSEYERVGYVSLRGIEYAWLDTWRREGLTLV